MKRAKIRVGIWHIAIFAVAVSSTSTLVTHLLVDDPAPLWKELASAIVWALILGCIFFLLKGYERLSGEQLSS